MPVLINVALSQIGWFALVLSAARGAAWTGIAGAGVLIAVHLVLSPRRGRELTLLLCCAAVGLLVDGALLASGAIEFPHSHGALPPAWMSVLWMMLGTTLCHSLRRLQDHPVLASVTGLLGGPLAYTAGARLGALLVPQTMRSLVTIALLWSLALPALLRLAREIASAATPAMQQSRG